MISVMYASFSTFIIGWLFLQVTTLRRKYRVSIGDGNNKELEAARAAHFNAIENIPIAIILLFALELNHAPMIMIHFFGVALITSRIIHAKAMLSNNLKNRVLGMKITFFTILGLAVVNFVYLPYGKMFSFA